MADILIFVVCAKTRGSLFCALFFLGRYQHVGFRVISAKNAVNHTGTALKNNGIIFFLSMFVLLLKLKIE